MKNINVIYASLENHYDKFIRYALKTCGSFSLVFNQLVPFSKEPPAMDNSELAEFLSPFLIQQIKNAKSWPGTKTKAKHKILNTYQCANQLQTILLNNNFLESIRNELPEDICFYRNNTVWLTTVSHEKLAFITNPTFPDIEFLTNTDIIFSPQPEE